MLLIVDNYDSFTWNLVQAFGALTASDEIRVVRNDAQTVDELVALHPRRVVISPGPGEPGNAGVSLDLIRRLVDQVPILGVCLGHQCLASAFGGRIVRAGRLVHGKTTPIRHDGAG
ncbi:MAG: gamma-glutamyl-gamma-aminobutyrate hydrolase family protein, partial [Phycisphaerales bacterium]|nr:gamma-glutamyl-gamma-aminobutyrate hydrolase family protein [Phycisphaerales bacterium]